MNELSPSLNDDLPERRWIADFHDFRTCNEVPRRTIDDLRGMAFEVVKVWLKVVAPSAAIVEPSDQSARRIGFHCRSEMRRFMHAFGGRQLPPSKDGGQP